MKENINKSDRSLKIIKDHVVEVLRRSLKNGELKQSNIKEIIENQVILPLQVYYEVKLEAQMSNVVASKNAELKNIISELNNNLKNIVKL